ncbi:dihydroflavonol 4-reductase [Plakobranchus ocellatus]|uniref:Dihydroflavonol 4-reductase n=1 Tax=Plakobranchus ocellatus TaxID=259542 RepID=A0AAV4C3X5_9GAST|nr:dihydroflavonol 4-reductase [Plakobranchus ocellatus]
MIERKLLYTEAPIRKRGQYCIRKECIEAFRVLGIKYEWNFLFEKRPQQGDLRLSGPPSGQGAGGGARTRDRRVSADNKADSLATVPLTPPSQAAEY